MAPVQPRRRLTLSSLAWLRLIVAGAVALMLSGLPQGAAELYVDHLGCCSGDDCPGSDGEGHCPPDCKYGACAKGASAMLQTSTPDVAAAASESGVAAFELSAAPSGVRDDVFHPPRREAA